MNDVKMNVKLITQIDEDVFEGELEDFINGDDLPESHERVVRGVEYSFTTQREAHYSALVLYQDREKVNSMQGITQEQIDATRREIDRAEAELAAKE